MSTLQVGISSPDISVLDERYGILNEVATPPPAPRTSNNCRSSALVRLVDPQTPVIRRGLLATAFLEDLRDAIVALDALGRCLFVNRAFETMTGSSRTELLGTVLGERIDDPQQSSWSSLARIFATPETVALANPAEPLHTRFKLQRADGSYLDAAVRWDRFPGSRTIGASFLLCKELMTAESELQARMTELRILRDELNILLDAKAGNENTAYGRWEAHTNQHTEVIGRRAGRPELSRREQEVLHSVLDGNRIGTIAATLFLSENTVRNHLKRIYKKLGVRSLGELREHCSSV
jgi:PAS domain S-box-containing protein